MEVCCRETRKDRSPSLDLTHDGHLNSCMFPRIFATWIQWVLKGIGKLLVFLLLLSAPSAVVITTVSRRWRRGAAPINPFPPPPLKSGDPRCSHSHNAGRSSPNTTQRPRQYGRGWRPADRAAICSQLLRHHRHYSTPSLSPPRNN